PKGYEENLDILLRQQARQLGELHIVANQDADLAEVRFKGLESVAALHDPILFLVGGGMNLVLAVDGATAAAQEADIVEIIVLHHRHGAVDNIDVVAHRQAGYLVENLVGVGGQVPNGVDGIGVPPPAPSGAR